MTERTIGGPARRPGEREPSARLTREAHTRLSEELGRLTTEGRERVAERLLRAREFGDIRENAEYDAAKNEQGLMESRIRKLQAMLKDPEIVEATDEPDAAGPGTIVTLRPLDDDDPEEERFLLAVSAEERKEGVRTVTTDSPLGGALLGKRPGERVDYAAPGGSFAYEIVGIEPYRT